MTISNFIWDVHADSCLLERDDAGVTTTAYTSEPVEFGRLLSQTKEESSAFHHYDCQSSTRQLTDDTEATKNGYVYNAYGEVVVAVELLVNTFQFVGRLGYYLDDEVASYSIRKRGYIPSTARWLSYDSIGIVSLATRFKSSNLYGYVSNSPLNYSDPSGNSLLTCTDCPQRHGFPNITWYGCHCGPGNGIGSNRPAGQLPVDPLDNCCVQHDAAYGANGCPAWDPILRPARPAACDLADQQICRCMLTTTCNRYGFGTRQFRQCMTYRRDAMALFDCEVRFGIRIPGIT